MDEKKKNPKYVSVKPLSNLLLEKSERKQCFFRSRRNGLGDFNVFSDDELLTILGFCSSSELLTLATVSKPFNALSNFDSLWKQLFLNEYYSSVERVVQFNFNGSYKRLVTKISLNHEVQANNNFEKYIYYSNTLYNPYLYKFSNVKENILSKCEQECGLMEKCHEANLSVSDFISKYEAQNQPLLIKSAIQSRWSVFRRWIKSPKSSRQPNLGQEGASEETLNTIVRAGELNVSLKDFLSYCENCVNEENQLYLFDCALFRSSPHFSNLFSSPKYFEGRDLLSEMGENRPDFSWIIAGAAESCSKWHIDPNYTHAWNAVISGKKLWLMLPFECAPCGVYPSEDLMDVTQPLSLAEWFHNYFDSTVETWGNRLIFSLAGPGDLVFVPSRWWHCVVNLEPTVAITQNYIALSNLPKSLNMMKSHPELVSGLNKSRDKSKLFEEFVTALKDSDDWLNNSELQSIVAKIEEKTSLPQEKVRSLMWEKLKRPKIEAGGIALEQAGGSFAFNFYS